MSEQAPQEPAPRAETDPLVRRLREFVSASIAIVIILGAVLMLIQAFNFLASPDEFQRVKDLLLFINPLLGVVIGFYFNRATSEARAETAETTAKSAVASAQQATEARDKAETEAKVAKNETEGVKVALKEVGQSAEKMMAQVQPAPGVLSLAEGGELVEDPRVEFKMAWSRARHFVE